MGSLEKVGKDIEQPLFADEKQIAGNIYKSLIWDAEEKYKIFIDIPHINKYAQELKKEYQL